jgi:hypothetical protein
VRFDDLISAESSAWARRNTERIRAFDLTLDFFADGNELPPAEIDSIYTLCALIFQSPLDFSYVLMSDPLDPRLHTLSLDRLVEPVFRGIDRLSHVLMLERLTSTFHGLVRTILAEENRCSFHHARALTSFYCFRPSCAAL